MTNTIKLCVKRKLKKRKIFQLPLSPYITTVKAILSELDGFNLYSLTVLGIYTVNNINKLLYTY